MVCAWSAHGGLMAVGGRGGALHLFAPADHSDHADHDAADNAQLNLPPTAEWERVARLKLDDDVTALDWTEDGEALLCATSSGFVGMWALPPPAERDHDHDHDHGMGDGMVDDSTGGADMHQLTPRTPHIALDELEHRGQGNSHDCAREGWLEWRRRAPEPQVIIAAGAGALAPAASTHAGASTVSVWHAAPLPKSAEENNNNTPTTLAALGSPAAFNRRTPPDESLAHPAPVSSARWRPAAAPGVPEALLTVGTMADLIPF